MKNEHHRNPALGILGKPGRSTTGNVLAVNPTEYAASKGVGYSGTSECLSWLRTTIGTSQDSAYVYRNRDSEPGFIEVMYPVNWEGIGVWPAVWVNLDADILNLFSKTNYSCVNSGS